MKRITARSLRVRFDKTNPSEGCPIRNHRSKKSVLALSVGVLLPIFLSSCIIQYRGFPAAWNGKPPHLKSYDLLSYQIRPFAFPDEGGEAALRSVFDNRTPFANTAAVMEMPRKGVYCLVDVKWTPPGITAAIFKYVSLLTLTALPSWSLRESYTVRYHLFINGKGVTTLEYKITRKSALWLGFLPVIWLNLSTHSQAEAFEATALQFFEDAKPIFTTLDPHELIIY